MEMHTIPHGADHIEDIGSEWTSQRVAAAVIAASNESHEHRSCVTGTIAKWAQLATKPKSEEELRHGLESNRRKLETI
jgi:hypothetical protein